MIRADGSSQSVNCDSQLAAFAGLDEAELRRFCTALPVKHLAFTALDRVLLCGSRAHWRTAALVYEAINAGAGVWLLESFDAGQALSLIDAVDITVSDWLPHQLSALIQLPAVQKSVYKGRCHRAAWVGGARLPVAVQRDLADWWGSIMVTHLSEAHWPGCFLATGDQTVSCEETVGTWCAPDRSYVRSVASNGEDCLPGQIGRCLISAGYLLPPAEQLNAEEYLGYFDAEAQFYPLGLRRNSLATPHGWFTPYEGERVLEAHSSVAEAALIAIEEEDIAAQNRDFVAAGAAGFYAAVQLRPSASPGTPLLELELLEWCARSLAVGKSPVGLMFVENLPRTEGGAIDLAAVASWLFSD